MAAPSFSPGGGTSYTAKTVTISDSTAGSTIYYTTDGTTPTTGSATYSTPITVATTQTLQAIASASGYAISPVSSAVYIEFVPANVPGFSPSAGTYSLAQSVTISDATPYATIYYTTNGYSPLTGSTMYSGPITVATSETVTAIAIATGSSQSLASAAAYIIGNPPAAMPTFSPGVGTYTTAQTVTISDATSSATIHYTTDGTTPTTNSAVYSGTPINVSSNETLKAIATAPGYLSSLGTATYAFSTTGSCNDMNLGTPTAGGGGGELNGFLPFPSSNPWNTNIANAPVDPNSSSMMGAISSTLAIHPDLGNGTSGGIPYIVVDSTLTPQTAVTLYNQGDYGSSNDVVVAPMPENLPIENFQPPCGGSTYYPWPEGKTNGDAHSLVLDRHTCWLYEFWSTNECDGTFETQTETIWDMQNNEYRPWGWDSADAAGLSVFAGLVRYDEANAGAINHAIRFTMQNTSTDDHIAGGPHGGYFVLPATHGDSSSTTSNLLPMGARLRLKAGTANPGGGPINAVITTALKQYGMILADKGGDFFIIGSNDQRWNTGALGDMGGLVASDFEVVQMTPSYPGMDKVSAYSDYPGSIPTINSFTATDSNGHSLTDVSLETLLHSITASAATPTITSITLVRCG